MRISFGTYLMQLTGREMTIAQNSEVSKFLHTLSDFERLGDHASNISKVANELYEKRLLFPKKACMSWAYWNPPFRRSLT